MQINPESLTSQKKWLKRVVSRSWWSGKVQALLTSCRKKITQAVVAARFWCVYHKCTETPLYRFIEFADGNTKSLRRRLFPSQHTLVIAGTTIQAEFSQLCGEKMNQIKGNKALRLRILIAQLQSLLEIYDKATESKKKIEAKIFEIASVNDIETAYRVLNMWVGHLKIEEEISEKEKKATDQYERSFLEFVVEVGMYLEKDIDLKKTTVAEFACYLRIVKRRNEAQNKEKSKKFGTKG